MSKYWSIEGNIEMCSWCVYYIVNIWASKEQAESIIFFNMLFKLLTEL